MSFESSAEREAWIQRQFDQTPYPREPIETAPDSQPDEFHAHSLATAFYARDRRSVSSEGMQILDVGCGSGFKGLMLAHLNPGTTITGIDLSPASIDVAIERFRRFDLLDRAKFLTLNIDQLPSLNQQFDYINCDEVLYLLEDPLASLRLMASVLKPTGILRVNLHSFNTRIPVLCAQEFLRDVGAITPDRDEKTTMALVESIVLSLNPRNVDVRKMWDRNDTDNPDIRERILAFNFMLHGDRGFSVPEVFDLVDGANLQVIAPVEPQDWAVKTMLDLEQFPEELRSRFAQISCREQMHWHDLLVSRNRLIDIFCTPKTMAEPPQSPTVEQLVQQPDRTQAVLHPLLNNPEFEAALVESCRYLKPLNFAKFLRRPEGIAAASASLVPVLVPLLTGPQPITQLIDRFMRVRPLNPVDRLPVDRTSAAQAVCSFLRDLETFGYIFLESTEV